MTKEKGVGAYNEIKECHNNKGRKMTKDKGKKVEKGVGVYNEIKECHNNKEV